jgi:hypothetical protein
VVVMDSSIDQQNENDSNDKIPKGSNNNMGDDENGGSTQAAMGVGILANNPLDCKMISRPPIVRLVLPQCTKAAFSIE